MWEWSSELAHGQRFAKLPSQWDDSWIRQWREARQVICGPGGRQSHCSICDCTSNRPLRIYSTLQIHNCSELQQWLGCPFSPLQKRELSVPLWHGFYFFTNKGGVELKKKKNPRGASWVKSKERWENRGWGCDRWLTHSKTRRLGINAEWMYLLQNPWTWWMVNQSIVGQFLRYEPNFR